MLRKFLSIALCASLPAASHHAPSDEHIDRITIDTVAAGAASEARHASEAFGALDSLGAAAAKQDPKPLKALSAWMKLYRRGKIDFRSKEAVTKDSVAVKYKLRSKGELGNATWAGDLRVICKALAKRNDAEAARAIADVASVGLDSGKYSYAQAPYQVRKVALDALAEMSSAAAKEELATGARGDWKTRKRSNALRSAAIQALGRIGDPAHMPILQSALSDGDPVIRIQTVDALKNMGGEEATKHLIGIVERENDDAVLVTAAKALREIYGKFAREQETTRDRQRVKRGKDGDDGKAEGDKDGESGKSSPPQPATARLAVRAAVKALGRTTWRADMVLVRLLDDFRSAEAIPALISVLERFRDHPEEVESGRLSGLLQVRVHELLVGMTGAVFPASDAQKWRDLWERDKAKIAVVSKAEAESKKSGGTSAGGFVGIPIEGTRVVFILDLSGSMDWPMDDTDRNRKVRRLDYAKRELLKAIDGLAPNARFNLVTFNGDDSAEAWNKKLVLANDRNKKRFAKFVEKLRPLGGTNLWSGIEKALDIKTLEYGNHYETTVDEIFLLSDGAPSVGEVVDPVEILRLVQEINRFKEVRINTVFISSQTPRQVAARQGEMSLSPKELMKRMAKENGGKFRDV
ncbi:MAG: HEAT repeat domain-containing protein [Planctomycetota bacterium]